MCLLHSRKKQISRSNFHSLCFIFCWLSNSSSLRSHISFPPFDSRINAFPPFQPTFLICCRQRTNFIVVLFSLIVQHYPVYKLFVSGTISKSTYSMALAQSYSITFFFSCSCFDFHPLALFCYLPSAAFALWGTRAYFKESPSIKVMFVLHHKRNEINIQKWHFLI